MHAQSAYQTPRVCTVNNMDRAIYSEPHPGCARGGPGVEAISTVYSGPYRTCRRLKVKSGKWYCSRGVVRPDYLVGRWSIAIKIDHER